MTDDAPEDTPEGPDEVPGGPTAGLQEDRLPGGDKGTRKSSDGLRRLRVVSFVVGVLVVLGLVDHSASRPATHAGQSGGVQISPTAAPAAALSSSWFCAGATSTAQGAAPTTTTTTTATTPTTTAATSTAAKASGAAPGAPASSVNPAGDASGQVVIANAGSLEAEATVSVVGSAGTPAIKTVDVPPRGSVSVPEVAAGDGGWAGAIVEADAGQVVVYQSVSGPLGASVSPCATSGSPTWYLPGGQTRVNADEYVSLLNPYPTSTIVDLSFVTNQGSEQPQNFQGIDVPADGLATVDLGSYLSRRSSIETIVKARTGSVVAWETEVVTPPPSGAPLVGSAAASKPLADPAWPTAGVTVTLGSPGAATSWSWPDGLAGNNLQEQYVVFNPGSVQAKVRLSIGIAGAAAEPFDFSVGPGQVVPVVSEQQARIPAGVAHTATLTSTNSVPVVAVRTLTASGAAIPVSGVTGTVSGNGQILGETASAASWLVAATGLDSHHVGEIVVYNPGATTVTARVTALSAGPAPALPNGGALTIAPGGQASLATTSAATGPLQVTASSAVFVEYDLYGVGGVGGIGLSPAVPLSNH
jgi:hypothetical protein